MEEEGNGIEVVVLHGLCVYSIRENRQLYVCYRKEEASVFCIVVNNCPCPYSQDQHDQSVKLFILCSWNTQPTFSLGSGQHEHAAGPKGKDSE